MDITVRHKNGITLKTAGKYCQEDIVIAPKLEDKTIRIDSNTPTVYKVQNGYCGIKSITIIPNVPVNESYPNAEEVSF